MSYKDWKDKLAYSVTINGELVGLVVCEEFEGWMLYHDQKFTENLVHSFVLKMVKNMGFENEEEYFKTIPRYSKHSWFPRFKYDIFKMVRYGLICHGWDDPDFEPILKITFTPMFCFDHDDREFDLKYIYMASGSGGFACMFLIQPTKAEYEAVARYVPYSIAWTFEESLPAYKQHLQVEKGTDRGSLWLEETFGDINITKGECASCINLL